MNGSATDDLIVGLAGADVLNGLAGNDILVGGPGGNTGTYADTSYTGLLEQQWDFDVSPSTWTEIRRPNHGQRVTGGQIRINGTAIRCSSVTTTMMPASAARQIQRVLNLAGVTSASISYSYVENSFDAGEIVTVEFSPNGIAPFQVIQMIDQNSNTGTTTNVTLTGPFTANAVIRFVVSGTNNNNAGTDLVSIDNLAITSPTPA